MNHHQELSHRSLLRWGAACGILGVVAALVQTAIDPHYADDPGKAVRQASVSHLLTFSRVLDMTAFLLLLVGVTVILRVFAAGPGAGWARLAGTLFTVSAAAGSIATMVVGSLPGGRHPGAQAGVRRLLRLPGPRQRRDLRGLVGSARRLRSRVHGRAQAQ
jgi:hypothetical protein